MYLPSYTDKYFINKSTQRIETFDTFSQICKIEFDTFYTFISEFNFIVNLFKGLPNRPIIKILPVFHIFELAEFCD